MSAFVGQKGRGEGKGEREETESKPMIERSIGRIQW